MEVKIDTKEHFRIFRVKNAVLYANMSGDLMDDLLKYVDKLSQSAIIVLEEVKSIDEEIAEKLAQVQAIYNDKNLSFVVTGSREINRKIEDAGISATPTLQEAIDVVMMEQLERELWDPENEEEGEKE